jgi:hypothetical protein
VTGHNDVLVRIIPALYLRYDVVKNAGFLGDRAKTIETTVVLSFQKRTQVFPVSVEIYGLNVGESLRRFLN